jgi:hypothetical protein
MAGDEHEEGRLLRSRAHTLAERSGLPVPPVEIAHDPRGRLAPARVTSGDDDREIVTVSSSVLHASPVEQVWHLAAALGHWVSPAPRRLRRWSRVLAGVLAVWSFGYDLLELGGVVDLPGPRPWPSSCWSRWRRLWPPPRSPGASSGPSTRPAGRCCAGPATTPSS